MKVLHGTFLLAFGTLMVAGSPNNYYDYNNHFRSDYEYHSSAQGWFKLHRAPAKWEDARIQCTLEGAVLASPINVDVSDVMHSIVSKAGNLCSSGVYTGVHNTISNTEFTSIEGVTFSKLSLGNSVVFSKECSTEPTCMRLVSRDRFVAGSCTDALPYVCYKKKTANLKTTECGTTDTAYRPDNRTGHCYKFHKYTRTWPLAFLTCAAEGGYLAVINSAAEGALVKELFDQYPREAILGPSKDAILLGFYDWNEKGIWRTIHGETLEEAGFAQWSGNQPDNYIRDGIGQHCGAMFRSGQLDDTSCDHQLAFVCEKDPKSLLPIWNQCPVY